MGNDVPRRLKRFYREGVEPPGEEKGMDVDRIPVGSVSDDSASNEPSAESDQNEIAKALAMDEVERFKEEHKRLPKKEEYDQIAENIFSQLKDKEQQKKAIERIERKRGKKPGEDRKEVQGISSSSDNAEGKKESEGNRIDRKKERFLLRHGKPVPGMPVGKEETVSSGPAEGGISSVEKELKDMNIEDLFSDEKKKGREKEGLEELEGIEGEFNLEGMENGDDDEGKGGQEKCPKCGKPAEEVIFCPECGAAFCEKCAKKVEVVGNARNIVCPGCGKKIKK